MTKKEKIIAFGNCKKCKRDTEQLLEYTDSNILSTCVLCNSIGNVHPNRIDNINLKKDYLHIISIM